MSKNKKELKSLIVSNTLIFVFVMVLVNLFIGVFKEENLLVGIMSIALMLVCLSIDLTIHPIKSSLYLIGFNVSLGLLAFLVSQNVILGLSINFAVMAFIGYYFSFEFIKPINMLVGLHYIFLVAKPVSYEQLPLRLMALVAGALMIMCVQLLVNKNKLVKCRDKYINSICNSLLEKIDSIKAKEDTDTIDSDINSSVNNLKSIIFASGKNNYCIAKYSVNTINILASLEKINTILDNLNKVDLDFLDDVIQVIKSINAKDSDLHVDLINLESKYENNLSSLDVDEFINIYDFIVTIKTLNIELDNYNKIHK